jgi:hypothetical protein
MIYIIAGILIIIGTVAGFILGFYFGYLKRENKTPDIFPMLNELREYIGSRMDELELHKEKEDNNPKSYFDM